MNTDLIELNKKRARHTRILRGLELSEQASVEELTAEFGLSEATIRRDLEEIEQSGRIIRVRGGARILSGLPGIIRKFGERSKISLAEKNAIVAEAEKHIPDGGVVILDNGTTSWLLAKRLKQKKNLTVITNSLPIVEELGGCGDMKVLLSGGVFRQRNLDFIGADAAAFFREISADIAVMTCDSVKPALGIYKQSEESADIARAMTGAAEKVFVIADHSKIGAAGMYRCLKPEDVDVFFIDASAPEKTRAALQEVFLKVVYC
ncbi:MAG: DeoR/GlpR family DNA-binding transcription regulator [Spirochaetales bacterium]|jgi:DeoR/GlpR family transcriptional regulator of sugar metabolism|nr:DeoR/GlpR family DNA-binding transcription regulator [Spirochaetales bacterium]